MFNHKGSTHSASGMGALITVFIAVGTLIYLGTRGFYYIRYFDRIYATNEQTETEANFAAMSDFDFLIGFNREWSSEYGEFEVSLDTYLNSILISTAPVAMKQCDPSHPGLNAVSKETGGQWYMVCPENPAEITIQSNHFSQDRT